MLALGAHNTIALVEIPDHLLRRVVMVASGGRNVMLGWQLILGAKISMTITTGSECWV